MLEIFMKVCVSQCSQPAGCFRATTIPYQHQLLFSKGMVAGFMIIALGQKKFLCSE